MYSFAYHRPSSAVEAESCFKSVEDARYLAGGQSILPMMKLRFAASDNIIDLRDVSELRGIEVASDSVTIGGLARHADVAASGELATALPSLAEMAGWIGDPQVRAQGTIGGSCANNDPAADYPAACLALDAALITLHREIAATDFFLGVFETALEEGELLTAVRFRRPNAGAYSKFRHPASRFALAGAYVARFGREVRVAISGAAAQGAFRWHEAEAALTANFSPSALANLHLDESELNSDMHADAAYRAHLAKVMVRRSVERCG